MASFRSGMFTSCSLGFVAGRGLAVGSKSPVRAAALASSQRAGTAAGLGFALAGLISYI